ncbi:MAG: NADH-quinone oxidoreductase subunit NuoB [Bacteroidota bacterium]
MQEGYLTTTVDAVTNWARSNSLMPMPMGLACCAIEMMAFAGPKADVSRFGSEAMRFSPRQADLMIIAGWVSFKMAHAIRRIWDQMPDPKWAIAQGACASTGGMHRCYGVVQGVDNFIPVDVYVPGCPPRPEAIIHALMDIQEKIRNEYSITQDEREAVDADGRAADRLDLSGLGGDGADRAVRLATPEETAQYTST